MSLHYPNKLHILMLDANTQYTRPGLLRYIAVMFYDSLLLLAVLFVATAMLIALNGGQAIHSGNPFFLLYLLFVSFMYFGWFWTHGGQTLGMKSWRVQLVCQSQQSVSWTLALIRFAVALLSWLPLGLGFWWQYLANDKSGWPDIASNSRLIVIASKKS